VATINDVSKLAKVSLATVSRVVNQPEIVNPKTRARVLQAIEELNYRPNIIARSLLAKRTFAVGIVINNFTSYYGALLQGAERELRRQGLTTIVCSSAETAEGERQAINFLRERQCDAAIYHLEFMPDDEIVSHCLRSGTFVLMNRHIGALSKNCVYIDNFHGGAAAARHLFEHGHRKIATITGPINYPEARDRLTGFRDELARLGAPLAPSLVFEGAWARESGYRLASQVFDRLGEVTAVFCQNDEMALGLIEAARQLDVSIPDHLSVVGYDDMEFAEYITPKLTTVRQPLFEIGLAAGALAKALLDKDGETDVARVFEPVMVERDSVAAI
jgi:LacI family transcriptional regulator